ncbi:MAG: hypothetical protein ABUJ98_15660 [Hyphomicrobium sp.]
MSSSTSDVTIINGALAKIGLKRIDSRGENSEQSRLADDTYDDLLDAVLTDAPWDFAITRQELSENATAPLFDFEHAYNLPGTPYCLKPLEIINLNEYEWRVEGRKIVTGHEAPLQLIYIARITDESVYTPQFIEAFQARLALEWSERLTRNTEITKLMVALYAEKIAAAKAIEAGQTGLHADGPDGTWVTSRI